MEILKSNIIDIIRQIEDQSALSKINEFVNALPTSKNNHQAIQPIELKTSISLEDIHKEQKIEKISFEEVQKMFEDEVWEQSLSDLLNSID